MTYDDTSGAPNLLLAHPGTKIIEVFSKDDPDPHDVRYERAVVAWELAFDRDLGEWRMYPWVIDGGVSAGHWEWPDTDDVDIILEQTPLTAPTVTAHYTVDEQGRWIKVEDDESEEAATGS